MKKQSILKFISIKIAFSAMLLCIVISSCKKESVPVAKSPVIETPVATGKVSNESLIKFLSITLEVEKSEIAFDSAKDEFIVRGQLKFDRTETEKHYNEANVYQAIHGK